MFYEKNVIILFGPTTISTSLFPKSPQSTEEIRVSSRKKTGFRRHVRRDFLHVGEQRIASRQKKGKTRKINKITGIVYVMIRRTRTHDGLMRDGRDRRTR